MSDPLLPADRPRVQVVALLFALSLLLLGVFGFVPGITTQSGDLKLAGDSSGAQLLGVFQTSVLHNLIHGVAGIVGIAVARSWEGARGYLVGGGALFVVLWLLGIAGAADWIPSDSAGNWLHLGLGVSMISLALFFGRARTAPARS